jgi:hypothetical protein
MPSMSWADSSVALVSGPKAAVSSLMRADCPWALLANRGGRSVQAAHHLPELNRQALALLDHGAYALRGGSELLSQLANLVLPPRQVAQDVATAAELTSAQLA